MFPHSLKMYLSKFVLISGNHIKFHKFSNSQLFLKHNPWDALGGSALAGVGHDVRGSWIEPARPEAWSLSHCPCLSRLLLSLSAKYT